jgi:hypothetical protein
MEKIKKLLTKYPKSKIIAYYPKTKKKAYTINSSPYFDKDWVNFFMYDEDTQVRRRFTTTNGIEEIYELIKELLCEYEITISPYF